MKQKRSEEDVQQINEFTASFLKAIRHRCVDLELNASELASKAGINPSTLSMVKQGKNGISICAMLNIAKAVGLEISCSTKQD